MNTLKVAILLASLTALNTAYAKSTLYLSCHGDDGLNSVALNLYQTDGEPHYYAEISVYPRLAHIPSPPPVTDRYENIALKEFSGPVFMTYSGSFVLRIGNPSDLLTSKLNIDVVCSQQNQ